jgi:signal transduction histidine kinase/ActR/RegA family two-component response regulator
MHSDSVRRAAIPVPLAIAATVFLCTTLVALLARHLAHDVARDRATLALDAHARALAHELDIGMRRATEAVRRLALDVQGEIGRDDARLRGALDTFRYDHPDFAWIGVVDTATSRVRAGSPRVFEGGSASGRDIYERGREGPFFGDVHEAIRLAEFLPPDANGRPPRFVDIAFPIRGASGGAAGVLAAHLDWRWADAVRREVIERAHGTLERARTEAVDYVIVAQSGRVLLGNDRFPAGASIQRTPGELFAEAATLGAGTWPGLGWRVVVTQPVDAAVAMAPDILRATIPAGAALALVAGLVATALGRRRRVRTSPTDAEDVRHEPAARESMSMALAAERAARGEAERLARMKDEFLAVLSHELRTPINAISGWCHVLVSPNASSDDRQRACETIVRNVRTQTELIDRLLDMSRLNVGKLQPDLSTVCLDRLVEETMQSMQHAFSARGIRVRTHLPEAHVAITGDEGRLRQILVNLLSNAVKFSRSGGNVAVTLARMQDQVLVTVADDGVGIDPALMPNVFNRFEQADSSSSRRSGGLGIGLALARSLAELHGGTLTGSSPGVDRGATFVLQLPAGASPQRVAEATAPSGTPGDAASPMSVLVVDDEPDAREFMRRCLEERGMDVTAVDGARRAVEVMTAAGCRIDVLVSDIGMPDDDGYWLIAKVRNAADPRIRDIPAIAVTAYARSEDRARVLGAGFDAHISKPVDIAKLVTQLQAVRVPISIRRESSTDVPRRTVSEDTPGT